MTEFTRFIVIGSLKESSLTKLCLFLNEKKKKTPAEQILKLGKKIETGNLLVEADKKYAENLFKMKTFHNLNWKVYPYKKLITSKWIIINRELSLATHRENANSLRKVIGHKFQKNSHMKCQWRKTHCKDKLMRTFWHLKNPFFPRK